MVTVVPVTSNVARIFLVSDAAAGRGHRLARRLKAQTEQVRSVTVERVGPVLGPVPADVMSKLDDALRLHLQL
ncbi:MAG: type II toxin-antitoxin system PemK/MazF family toxin [Geodermatophilaceae bacterium]